MTQYVIYIAFAVICVSTVFIIDGAIRYSFLLKKLRVAWQRVPRDPETGLYDKRVCLQRVAAELKRSSRTNGTVWIAMLTVLEGDPDRFGRLLQDSIRVPEVAFRLSKRVVCVVRPDLDAVEREQLLGRIVASAPRERLALGEQVWRGEQDGDAAELLRRVTGAMREVRST